MKPKDVTKIARYLKVPAAAIKEVLVMQFSKDLDQIIALSKNAQIGTGKDYKLTARWNELFFEGLKDSSNTSELEYFRNKYPPDNKPYAIQMFTERLKYLEIIAMLADSSNTSNNIEKAPAIKKTDGFVEKIVTGIRPTEYKAMYENTQDEISKACILKAWAQSYHINIKYGETIKQVKEALENSPYEHIGHEKFVKFSKKAIKKWVTLTETPVEAFDLHYYCFDMKYTYSIDQETMQLIFRNLLKILSEQTKETDNKKSLKDTYNTTDAPDIKIDVIKKVCDIKKIPYGQFQDS